MHAQTKVQVPATSAAGMAATTVKAAADKVVIAVSDSATEPESE